MSLNTLDIADRIAGGKKFEATTIDLLETKDVYFDGHRIVEWCDADETADMIDKVDCWGVTDDGFHVATQVKYRETGKDFGIAAVIPYKDHATFVRQWESNTIPWDRDMATDVDLNVCHLGGRLVVARNDQVKVIVMEWLERLAESVCGFGPSGGVKHRGDGVELILKTDVGRGHTYGMRKIICYITLDRLLDTDGAAEYVV